MKRLLSAVFLLASLQSFASTAILCGAPSEVDANEKDASVWIVLDNEIPSSPDEIGVSYFGKSAPVSKYKVTSRELVILTKNPMSELRVNLKDIAFANCEGDDRLFSIRKKVDLRMSDMIIDQCRCFSN